MKIESRHLEIMARVVEHGGVTAAAAALGKSQPSVSRTLAFLEARVGQPLFVTGRRPLQPTELGRKLAEKGRLVLRATDEASETAKNYRLGRSGAVRVGGTPFFMDGVVSRMLAEFQTKNIDVQIEQTYGYANELLKKILDNRLDLVLCPLSAQQISGLFDFKPLLNGRNVVACSKTHPLIKRSDITSKEIFELPWILPPEDSPLYADLKQQLLITGVTNFKASFSGGTLASTLAILVGSNALTILPSSVVEMATRTDSIAALPIRLEHPNRTLGIVTSRSLRLSPAIVRARDFLALQFAGLSDALGFESKHRHRPTPGEPVSAASLWEDKLG
jgi:DNA-binding transcriptional LysR family regulator